MIEADAFIQELKRNGFGLVSGVPCSYLTPLINTVIDSDSVDYIGAANEGEAVAIATGAQLGGQRAVAMFQNSGLGNAVSPLTSLNALFRIPILIITTWRGQPGGPADEPQHALMGRITAELFDTMQIPWAEFPREESAISETMARAVEHMDSTGGPFALIMRKGSVAEYELQTQADLTSNFMLAEAVAGKCRRFDPDQVLKTIQKSARPDDILIATTGFTGRALYACGDRPNQLYMVGSMGCASSLALGLAKAQPDRRVIVIDGDGAFLMRMGALPIIGHQRPENLIHIVLDNSVHDSTGAQSTVSASIDMASLAAASGYPVATRVSDIAHLAKGLQSEDPGLQFFHVKTQPRADRKLPRPTITPAAVARRLQAFLGIEDGLSTGSLKPRRILMNPGPVTLSNGVRRAMLRDDLCHREPEFSELMADVRSRLIRVYPETSDSYSSVLLTGSGTSAVEAMVDSLVDGRALVVANGVYGERMATMLHRHGKPFDLVQSEWIEPMNLADVERQLAARDDYTHVLAVHHETTTGRLNDIVALGHICKAAGVDMLLDAVSSFGAEDIDFEACNIEACAATANKCLHGIPGVAFVIVRRCKLENAASMANSLYLDLHTNHAAQKTGFPAFTPAIQSLYALQQALIEFEAQGGVSARNEHYRFLMSRLCDGLSESGIRPLLEDAVGSCVLTSFDLPREIEFDSLFEQLKPSGFIIYPGQKHLKQQIFRLSVMGDVTERDMRDFILAFGNIVSVRRPSAVTNSTS